APLERAVFALDSFVARGEPSRGLRRIRRADVTWPSWPAFQKIAVPSTQIGSCLVGRDQERHQGFVGISGGLDGLVGEDEFRQAFVPERAIWLHGGGAVAARGRIGIG